MARKRNSLRRRNGPSYPSLSSKEKRQVEFFLVALAAGAGAVAGGAIAGVKGAAVGGAVGVAGVFALIYTSE